jgi:hypothetical protein
MGTGMGSIVFPAIVQHLIPHIGFAWALRVAGLVALFFCALALTILRPRPQQGPGRKDPLIDVGALREVPYVCFVVSSFLFFIALYFAFFYVSLDSPFCACAVWLRALICGSC